MSQALVNRRFQIVIGRPSAGEAENGYRLTPFGRFKTLLSGLILLTVALAVLIAALILGYIIAAVLSIVVIVAIAMLFVRSSFRGRRSHPSSLTRG